MPSPSAQIRIVTDTTAALPEAFVAAHQVAVAACGRLAGAGWGMATYQSPNRMANKAANSMATIMRARPG